MKSEFIEPGGNYGVFIVNTKDLVALIVLSTDLYLDLIKTF